jgi:hypothetical protein
VDPSYTSMILKKAKDRERYLRSRKFKSTTPQKSIKDIQIMTISRVWEKFLTRVGIGLLLCISSFSWIILVYEALNYFGFSEVAITTLVPVIAILLPGIVVMLRLTFNRCKDEVHQENEEMIEMIKGSD